MSDIVIIDDESYITESLTEILSLEDYNVIPFNNGWDAIEYVKSNPCDLVISDIEMPEIKGYEILEKIKSDLKTATIPFIFLSGLHQNYQIRKGMTLGADDYLTKPFDSEMLIKSVKARIEKSLKFEAVVQSKIDELRLSISTVLPHELLTPLNGILGPMQMLMESYDDFNKSEIQELHKVIYFCANRLKSLISNFLYYNELENKLNNGFKTEFVITSSNQHLLKISESIAFGKNRSNDLKVDLENYNHKIELDDFKKLFSELISNAFKFSSEGSEVVISNKKIEKVICYSIRDNGRGMNSTEISDIGAYKQFDRSKFEQQGLGLGLYLVKRISELYSLNVEFKSEPNRYTEVLISIPHHD
ncbi:hybrid sensor histidine kinase/response regulator [Candidatus Kapabacteria bacterium]|nr:hybrid sensor histidine kinase/response regulator [Candidatus Kapabacteria bacterium]